MLAYQAGPIGNKSYAGLSAERTEGGARPEECQLGTKAVLRECQRFLAPPHSEAVSKRLSFPFRRFPGCCLGKPPALTQKSGRLPIVPSYPVENGMDYLWHGCFGADTSVLETSDRFFAGGFLIWRLLHPIPGTLVIAEMCLGMNVWHT